MRPRKFPKLCLHKHSGQGYVTLAGRPVYLGVYGTEKCLNAYNKLHADWLLGKPLPAGSRQAREEAPGLTVTELLCAYDLHMEARRDQGDLSPGQLKRIRMAIKPCRLAYGATAAADFGPKALKAVRSELVKKGYARTFANSLVGCLKTAFSWAAGEELIPGPVAMGLRCLKRLRRGEEGVKEAPKVRAAPPRVIARVLPQLGRVARDLVRVQYLAGMRPGEACAMRPSEIDRQGQVPGGARFEGLWVYVPARHKTSRLGHPRIIFLGPRAQRILARHLEGAGEYVFCPRRAAMGFLRQNGRAERLRPRRPPGARYSKYSYRRAVAKAAQRASVELTPLQLRHTRATFLRSRYGPDTARVILGHHLPGVTGVYAEDDLAKAARAMREVG